MVRHVGLRCPHCAGHQALRARPRKEAEGRGQRQSQADGRATPPAGADGRPWPADQATRRLTDAALSGWRPAATTWCPRVQENGGLLKIDPFPYLFSSFSWAVDVVGKASCSPHGRSRQQSTLCIAQYHNMDVAGASWGLLGQSKSCHQLLPANCNPQPAC